jgi:hypothetical protein
VDIYLSDILSRGLTVECVGVMMAEEHALAKRVHRYMRADDPNSFKESASKIIPEVQNTKDGVGSFDDLLGLPPQVCKAVIDTLSTSGNYPIGEQPPKKVSVDQNMPGPVPAPATQPATEKSDMGFWIILGGGIGLLLVILLIRALANG